MPEQSYPAAGPQAGGHRALRTPPDDWICVHRASHGTRQKGVGISDPSHVESELASDLEPQGNLARQTVHRYPQLGHVTDNVGTWTARRPAR